MKKILISFFSIILLTSTANAACMTTKCTQDKVFEGWKGKNLDELIEVWGYPDSEKTIAGHKTYAWKQGTYKVKTPIRRKKRTVDFCTRTVEVNDSKTITAMKWRGGSCPITTFSARKWLNPDAKLEEE